MWYLVAAADDQPRTYRVSRVTAARLLDERFERPSGFDLAAFWEESSAAYEREAPRIDVTVRVQPDRLGRLRGAVGSRVVDAAERLPDPDPDGWLRLRLSVEWPDEAPAQLLGAGSAIEVLEPAELRERLVASARRILDRYGVDPATS